MSAAETNGALAAETLEALASAGVRTVCLCPGGRNAPLVVALDAARDTFDVVQFFDERSAAFFALGRIRRDGAPAAVVTTSGTAAAELLPAMVEAHHAGLPLVAVTADRPKALRGTGAPQTIDQIPLFAAAGAPVTDADAPGDIGPIPGRRGPVHLNICFDEPLLGAGPVDAGDLRRGSPREPEPWMSPAEAKSACEDFFFRARNPLVLVSSLDPADAARFAPWLASLTCPMYLEAVSQLRGHRNLQEFSLRSGERILPECLSACDGVLRIGGVPTPRFWRDCERGEFPVLHVSRSPLPGLGRSGAVIPPDIFLDHAPSAGQPGPKQAALFRRDRDNAARIEEILARNPRSEAALVRSLAERLPTDARVLLGNSLPIREWDLVAPRTPDHRTIFANRGANGIDGLVSTAMGLAGEGRPAAALLGDLSALYDLAGLWPAAQLPGADITVAVINNGGGKIFDRMFKHAAFLNAHGLRLRGWAEIFGWHYGTLHRGDEPLPPAAPRLVEAFPDPVETAKFADSYSGVWR